MQFLNEMKKYFSLFLIAIMVLSFGSRVVRAENESGLTSDMIAKEESAKEADLKIDPATNRTKFKTEKARVEQARRDAITQREATKKEIVARKEAARIEWDKRWSREMILANLEKHYLRINNISTKVATANIDITEMNANIAKARIAIDETKINFEKAKTIYNGIDTAKFKTDEVYKKSVRADFELAVKSAKESAKSAQNYLKEAVRALKEAVMGELENLKLDNGAEKTEASTTQTTNQ